MKSVQRLAIVACLALFSLTQWHCSNASKEAEYECFKGETYSRLGDQKKAIISFKKAIEHNSDYAEAYWRMGTAYAGLNNANEMEKAYRKSIEIDPKFLDAYYSLGLALVAKGNHEEGIKIYSKAIEIKPDSALGYNNLGVAYHGKGDYEKAVTEFKRAIEKQPKFTEAFFNLGNAYAKKNDLLNAVDAYTKATQTRTDYPQAYFELAVTYNKLGRNAEAFNNFGLYYFWNNNYNAAIEQFSRAVALDPTYSIGHNNLAFVFTKLGAKDRAIESYKKAASLGYEPAQEILKQNNITWAAAQTKGK
ncbi:MAG: tetratricopeptide repeat protein [Candidatus Kapaibacterium sp.]|jgi:tetratricopeptide (TPR) repeat protein